MSENLRKAFPRAAIIPFNPVWQKKLAAAKKDSKVNTIIIETNIPSMDTLSREKWIIATSIPDVMEIGCQDGHVFRMVPDSKFDLARWYGLDLDLWRLANFVQGDVLKAPFRDKCFETVVFAEIGEHVEDPVLALVESMRIAKNRVLITLPNEYMWSVEVLPFMKLEDKEKLDSLTHRQEIDKNSRWLDTCLNPKDKVASWDEEKFEHLWHRRHFYDPDEVQAIPSGRTEHEEVNLFEYLRKATDAYDAKYGTDTAHNWHYEKMVQPPWNFHLAIISLVAEPILTGYEFRKLLEADDAWSTQIMTGEQGEVVAFMRRS